jgi:hypothetical protein
MATIPDITDTEMWVTRTTLAERYGRDMEIQLADAGISLHPSDRELTSCPLTFWPTEDGCHFGGFKTGERNYCSQFYCEPCEQMGAGTNEYDDLTERLVATLQAQVDCAAERPVTWRISAVSRLGAGRCRRRPDA